MFYKLLHSYTMKQICLYFLPLCSFEANLVGLKIYQRHSINLSPTIGVIFSFCYIPSRKIHLKKKQKFQHSPRDCWTKHISAWAGRKLARDRYSNPDSSIGQSIFPIHSFIRAVRQFSNVSLTKIDISKFSYPGISPGLWSRIARILRDYIRDTCWNE